MPPSRRVLAVGLTAAVIGAGASAAPAGAASLAVVGGCVITAGNDPTPATIAGGGFRPGASVTLATTSKQNPTPSVLGSVRAKADGTFLVVSPAAPFNSSKTVDQTFTLIGNDGVLGASTPWRQVRLSYRRSPSSSRPTKRVKHVARGFTTGKTVYAHFRHRGKTRATRRLGVAKGPCGIVTKRMRALPAKSRLGLWNVYVDETKTYSSGDRPQARLSFEVVRKFF
jgi:hypothetical protein